MRLLKGTEEPHLNNMQCIWMVQVLYMKPYYTYVSKMFSKHIPKIFEESSQYQLLLVVTDYQSL